MKVYEVGGAVRDRLLGIAVQDHDYVVVGATPEEMISAGYKPVGADFPVFLHPQTHEEYALARTERKTAPGYKGFVFHTDPSVTLEEDLRRRDLTINAIAYDPDTGNIIDPYGGRADLERRLLRHVGDAFIEDPVRILRVARFAARFADRGFQVAEETLALMRRMVEQGEVDHLVAERVWQEVARGLMEPRPDAMFTVLESSGALIKILPELAAVIHPNSVSMNALARAVIANQVLAIRFGALCHAMPLDAFDSLCERLRAPAECRDLARMAIRHHDTIHDAPGLPAKDVLDLLLSTDALRRESRFVLLLDLCKIIHHQSDFEATYAPAIFLLKVLSQINEIDVRAISQRPSFNPSMIHEARLAKVAEIMRKEKP